MQLAAKFMCVRLLKGICVTSNIRNDIINYQLYAIITNFVDNFNQLNMFRAIISPILRSTRLCSQIVV